MHKYLVWVVDHFHQFVFKIGDGGSQTCWAEKKMPFTNTHKMRLMNLNQVNERILNNIKHIEMKWLWVDISIDWKFSWNVIKLFNNLLHLSAQINSPYFPDSATNKITKIYTIITVSTCINHTNHNINSKYKKKTWCYKQKINLIRV